MSLLMRAPEEVASWEWDLKRVLPSGLQPALETGVRMAAVLTEHGLLAPSALEWDWFVVGKGGIGVWTRLALPSGTLDTSDLAQRVLQCRPAGFDTAEPADILVAGYGEWFDADGQSHQERGLVELTVTPDELGPFAQLSVYHDIWSGYDFRGHPHPELHQRNAPRLAAALRALDDMLGVACEPGELTYFGQAEGHGVAAPELIDGIGPDLTDRL
ncbi:hypothetical protein [Streptomyces uncialis]|uniref:hypothetical protein n=1 Tax=Streptomyces uncialis TaxID=1048205 RepID=UPI0034079541